MSIESSSILSQCVFLKMLTGHHLPQPYCRGMCLCPTCLVCLPLTASNILPPLIKQPTALATMHPTEPFVHIHSCLVQEYLGSALWDFCVSLTQSWDNPAAMGGGGWAGLGPSGGCCSFPCVMEVSMFPMRSKAPFIHRVWWPTLLSSGTDELGCFRWRLCQFVIPKFLFTCLFDSIYEY